MTRRSGHGCRRTARYRTWRCRAAAPPRGTRPQALDVWSRLFPRPSGPAPRPCRPRIRCAVRYGKTWRSASIGHGRLPRRESGRYPDDRGSTGWEAREGPDFRRVCRSGGEA